MAGLNMIETFETMATDMIRGGIFQLPVWIGPQILLGSLVSMATCYLLKVDIAVLLIDMERVSATEYFGMQNL